ncbi:MAG: hypothetical protein AAF224_07080 [Pseudomonadota bacterium]
MMRILLVVLATAATALVCVGYKKEILAVIDPPVLEYNKISVGDRFRTTYAGVIGGQCSAQIRVLMIGNSLLHNQNVPEMVARIAKENNDCLAIEASLYGGGRLFEHVEKWDAVRLIVDGDWTHVLVQPQGMESLVGGERVAGPLRRLTSAIRQKGAALVLFEPWAYGPKLLSGANFPFGLKTQNEAQRRVSNNIRMLRGNNTVAPVGSTWRRFAEVNPDAPRLLDADDNHASIAGGFLEALVIYSTLFPDADLTAGTYRPRGVDAKTAILMRLHVAGL